MFLCSRWEFTEKPRFFSNQRLVVSSLTGAFYVGNGWVAGGCWGLLGVAGLIITSDDWDRSRKFPAFSTTIFFFKLVPLREGSTLMVDLVHIEYAYWTRAASEV